MKEPVLMAALAVIATACLSEAINFACPNNPLCIAIQAPKKFATRFSVYLVLLISFAGSQYVTSSI